MGIQIIYQSDYKKFHKNPIQKNVWDAIAKSWKTYVITKIPVVERFIKNKRGFIIDFGCGGGRNMLPHKDCMYYGIDFSKKQITQAKKYIKEHNLRAKKNIKENSIRAKIYKSRLDKLNKRKFKDNMFDHGLYIATLHCVESEKEREKSLDELYRVLKPGAQALITVWNSQDKRFGQVNNQGPVYLSWKENKTGKENKNIHMRFYYLYKKQELIDLIKKAGFKIIKFYPTKNQKDRFSRKNWIVKVKK